MFIVTHLTWERGVGNRCCKGFIFHSGHEREHTRVLMIDISSTVLLSEQFFRKWTCQPHNLHCKTKTSCYKVIISFNQSLPGHMEEII